MAHILAFIMALIALVGAPGGNTAQDAFTIDLTLESEGVYQIFYTYYLDGASCGMGAIADLDGAELTGKSDLAISLTQALLESDDPSGFSIDFSLYGQGDAHEAGTTNQVSIDAEYGGRYAVAISGSEADGFSARLTE